MFSEELLRAAHRHCNDNEREVADSALCGCFYCLSVFEPAEIEDWTDGMAQADEDPRTALCPRCGIDSIIGDASGYDVEAIGFLPSMHELWFKRTAKPAELRRFLGVSDAEARRLAGHRPNWIDRLIRRLGWRTSRPSPRPSSARR